MRFTFFGLKDSVTLYIFLSQESSGFPQKNCTEEMAGKIEKAFSSRQEITCDKYGTVFIPWSEVFQYGKAELSDEGKEFIDEVFDTEKEVQEMLAGWKA